MLTRIVYASQNSADYLWGKDKTALFLGMGWQITFLERGKKRQLFEPKW